MRGLDYYTSTVFEAKSAALGAQDTVGAGGRYNGLIRELGGPDLPGIGFGSGVERILLAASHREEDHSVDVFFVTLVPEARLPALGLAGQLRDEGFACDLDYADRKAKGQFKQADRAGALYTVVLGDEEIRGGYCTLRDMSSGEERRVPVSGGPGELLRLLVVSGPAVDIPEGLVEKLRKAESVAVLTGSGISAESGVPTFRDAQTGIWARYDPRELATPEAFMREPGLVWEWYEWRRKLVGEAEPNPGHAALAGLERRIPGFTLITQNVDGLHRRAGSENVLELHGNIQRTICSMELLEVEPAVPEEKPPPCPNCGSPLRPDVVWFGEALPAGSMEVAVEASRNCDVFLSIGTSSVVYPAASLPYEAASAGATLVEINLEKTPLTGEVDYFLAGESGGVLPALVGLVGR